MNDERIVTRCPSCGHQTLFIGAGGHLTCSWLPCRQPAVGDEIAALIAERDELRERIRLALAVKAVPDRNPAVVSVVVSFVLRGAMRLDDAAHHLCAERTVLMAPAGERP